jgi:hypothetical protein
MCGGYSSAIGDLPSMHNALDIIPSSTKDNAGLGTVGMLCYSLC